MDNLFEIDKLKVLLQKKKEKLLLEKTDDFELKKIEELNKLFNKDRCFFDLPFDVSINILKFLGIDDSKLLDTYKKLISYDVYKGTIKLRRDE